MRTLEKKLHTLQSDQLCDLIGAVVPLGRAAACARLVPRLCTILAAARPPPTFSAILKIARDLAQVCCCCCGVYALMVQSLWRLLLPWRRCDCGDPPPCSAQRVPLPEQLLTLLYSHILSELSGEGDGMSLAGSLESGQVTNTTTTTTTAATAMTTTTTAAAAAAHPPSTWQICACLWLFVRHLPYVQQSAPRSQIAASLPMMIERLLQFVGDFSSISSEQLCDVLEVLCRLGRGYAGNLLPRLVTELELRLTRGQLRPALMMQAAWALSELTNPASPHAMAGRLAAEATHRVRVEGEISANISRRIHLSANSSFGEFISRRIYLGESSRRRRGPK